VSAAFSLAFNTSLFPSFFVNLTSRRLRVSSPRLLPLTEWLEVDVTPPSPEEEEEEEEEEIPIPPLGEDEPVSKGKGKGRAYD